MAKCVCKWEVKYWLHKKDCIIPYSHLSTFKKDLRFYEFITEMENYQTPSILQ